ncbi:MAG: hypothetical protein LBU84_00825 [Prevotella sp.]|jgi:hypothetical protein|nr:hypothetical protein [Prevotella sp.]
MEYTLFFSYQSDTKHEFDFIKGVLANEVKGNLSTKGIDLKLDFGMRDVAGNPDLLITMLQKGEDCDIFLADLTYVTNFINANGKEKYVPNPNVMLELGHAWNFHGHNHTIFIQNKSKGKSEDLPVDLKGFRFPISYELHDNASEENKKDTRRMLCNDLTSAIEAVINSIEEGNKDKYLPFKKFAFCQLQRNSEGAFIETQYFEQFTKAVKSRLESNQFITITGKNGCGKSRIIKEFISRDFSESRLNNTLYCKYTQTDTARLCETLNKLILKELRRDTVLILDNCDDTIAGELRSILLGFQHRCIFIMESTSYTDSAPIKIDPKEYVVDIIANIAPGRESEIVAQCGYNPEYVIQTINNIPYTPYTYNVDSESTKLLSYISLFSKVGFGEYRQNEFEYICYLSSFSSTMGCSIVKGLIDKGYIIRQGGFIFIESDVVANEYAKKMWQQNLADEFLFDELLDKSNLAQWFINRQIQIAPKTKECAYFLKNIIKIKLRDISFVDSGLGKYITPKLAELYPKDVLTSLEILSNKNKDHDFQEIYGPLWAFDIIVRKEGLFNRAITLILNLQDGASNNKTDIKSIVSDHFKRINYRYNPNVSIESFQALYANGYIDIVKDVYSSIFNVGYKDLLAEQMQYLREMFSFLISIRVENKDWANSIIVDNVLTARHLGISRQVFAVVRAIVEEDSVKLNIAEVLTDKIKWATPEDRKSIKALLKSIFEISSRNMLYSKVVLSKSERLLDKETVESAMNDVAFEILKNKDWENDIDILLRGGRKYDANCLWFGYAISQQYGNCDKLITQCLYLYRDIPIEDQSYGFIIGVFHKYAVEDNMSFYKQKRDELLECPEFIHIAIALSNSCENTISDLMSIKKALIANSLSLVKLNDLYFINLTEIEYRSFATELINLSKDGSDTGIKLLDRAINVHKNIDISNCLEDILIRYNYWDASDCSYDSAYSKFIDLLIYTLNTHPNNKLAEAIIASMINGCDSPYFNNNCSVVDLFKILIERYQYLFLGKILPVIIDGSFDTYLKKRHIEGLFKFQHTADNGVYLEWCEKNGTPAAEFVANFISLLKEDNDGNIVWMDEAKTLMNTYSDNSYVLNNISTRLFNGEISIAKYNRLKKAYELLIDDKNSAIRLWAIEQTENMDQYIQRERDQIEVERVWYK